MGLFSGALDCDCCEEEEVLACMSSATPQGTTWYYWPYEQGPNTQPIAACGGTASPCGVQGYNWNGAYTAERFSYGTSGFCAGSCRYAPGAIVTCDGPHLEDPAFLFWLNTINNDPSAWVAPPTSWPGYPAIPAAWQLGVPDPWGGWVWGSATAVQPPKYQKMWDDPAIPESSWQSIKDWYPYWKFPLTTAAAGELCPHGTTLNPNISYTVKGLGGTGNVQKQFTYLGYGKAAHPIDGTPYNRSWFDYLSTRASQNFGGWNAPKVRPGPFRFEARSFLQISGGLTVWKYQSATGANGETVYSLIADTAAYDTGIVYSATLADKIGGSPQEAIQDGISMAISGSFPFGQTRTFSLATTGTTSSGFNSWSNIDSWLAGLSPFDGIFFGIDLSPAEFQKPPTISAVSQKGIAASLCWPAGGILPVADYHINHVSWKHAYSISVQGHIELRVTDVSNGQVSTITLDGHGGGFV